MRSSLLSLGVRALVAASLLGASLLGLAACGARTELGEADAAPPEGRDAGLPVRRDAGAPPRDAGPITRPDTGPIGVPDAGPAECPPPSELGYRVVSLGTLPGGSYRGLSLGGDGESVYLATSDLDTRVARLFRLDGASARGVEIASVPFSFDARVSVTDGVARMAAYNGEVVLVEARGEVAVELGRTTYSHISRAEPLRPWWNGREILLADQVPFFGPARIGGESPPWYELGTGETLYGMAVERSTGNAALLYWPGTPPDFRELRVVTFDPAGAILGPEEGVSLMVEERFNDLAFGWLEGDGGDAPIVVAGTTGRSGEVRATLRRYRLDGTPAGGFSAPVSGFGEVDLSTTPAPPHAYGYGMVFARFDTPALFHGAGEGFVGDATELPFSCSNISLAAGPCGYVIGCERGGTIQLALAVPPTVR